ncbi:hypothetical protein JYK04_08174 [Streptomyces nojiriensis]|nr:hypothetical protein JYK04_08174 [Streptomyces nojiriensis]
MVLAGLFDDEAQSVEVRHAAGEMRFRSGSRLACHCHGPGPQRAPLVGHHRPSGDFPYACRRVGIVCELRTDVRRPAASTPRESLLMTSGYPPLSEPFAEALGEAAQTAAMAYRLVMTISDAVRRATQ